MKSKKVKASVFIPLYNGEEYLEELLNAVFSQNTDFEFEVLATDSGSKDRTLEIAAGFPDLKLDKIPNSEFGHGKTRNRAAKMANGEFIVFLSQDAVPAHDKWLEYMIEPFYINPKLQGVFGRQIPRPIADVTTKREVSSVFSSLGPEHSLMIHKRTSLISDHQIAPALNFYSDVNSAARRDFLINELPYKDVDYSEDQLFGKDLMDGDYLKAYTPMGAVFHSNEYDVKDLFYRKFDENMGMFAAMNHLPPAGTLWHIRSSMIGTLKDLRLSLIDPDYSPKRKLYNFVTCGFRNAGHHLAAWMVAREKYRKRYAEKYSLESRNAKDQ